MRSPKPAHEGPLLLWLGPLVLAVLGPVAALFAGQTHHFLSSSDGQRRCRNARRSRHLRRCRISACRCCCRRSPSRSALPSISCRTAARRAVAGLLDAIGWGPDRGFDQAHARSAARRPLRSAAIVQSGRLDIYMKVTFIVIALALLVPMALFGEWPDVPGWPAAAVCTNGRCLPSPSIGLGAVLRANNRLTAIVSLGIQGFAVALLFMLLGAPDLSFTQFMIETLSVVILALVMTRLRLSPADHRPARAKTGGRHRRDCLRAGLRAAAAQGDATAVRRHAQRRSSARIRGRSPMAATSSTSSSSTSAGSTRWARSPSS